MKKYYIFILLLLKVITSYAAPPKAEEVFQVNLTAKENAVVLSWQIKPGFFLYKDRIVLANEDDNLVTLGQINYPIPYEKIDPQGKVTPIYRNVLKLHVNILGHNPGEDIITVRYQGCSDDGFCYPPQIKRIKLTLDTELHLVNAVFFEQVATLSNKNLSADIENKSESDTQSDTDLYGKIFNYPKSLILLTFFGFGLLLSFTPCVLPMIPILSGIIVGHKNISTKKAFFLSLSYVAGMSVTYAIAGAIIATIGQNLQVIMQSPLAIGIFSALFVILSLSMFDLYEIKLPLVLQNKIADKTKLKSSGHFMSAFIMGAFSILIISPCVTAPLIGTLGFIAQTGNVVLGGLILFFLSLGMGTPLLLIGTGAGKFVPKAGLWMNIVKGFFGILLLGVAITLLSRLVNEFITMLLWGALLIFSGIYIRSFAGKIKFKIKIIETLGIIFLTYGVLIIIGASIGNTNPWLPLQVEKEQIKNEQITVTSLSEALQAIDSNLNNKPIFIEFYANWCESCKHLEKTVFQDARVKAILNDFIVIKIDVTDIKTSVELFEHFNVVAPPTFLFLTSQGEEIKKLRAVGEVSRDKIINNLLTAIGNSN